MLRTLIFEAARPDRPFLVISMEKQRFDSPLGRHCEPLLVAEFDLDQEVPHPPLTVRLGFIANRFEGQPLSASVDGIRYELGQLARMRFVEGNQCRNLIHSNGVIISSTLFKILTHSHNLELRVGTRAFPLNIEHGRALRALAERI